MVKLRIKKKKSEDYQKKAFFSSFQAGLYFCAMTNGTKKIVHRLNHSASVMLKKLNEINIRMDDY